METIERQRLLKVLESVRPGLADREMVEQGTCFAFRDGEVLTFNEEVCCRNKSPLKDFHGCVRAKPLLDLLSKMSEDLIDIEVSDGEMIIKGQGRRAGLRTEAEVLLQVDSIENPEKEEWKKLPEGFLEAVGIVSSCVIKDDNQFLLTCVHIHNEYLEACDRFQVARYPISMDIKRPTLVRGVTLAKVCGYNMTEYAETASWFHFRDSEGLVFSCRRFIEDYKDLSAILSVEGGSKVNFPGSLEEIVGKAEVFSGENAISNRVGVHLKENRIEISGEGVSGWYKERKQIEYHGEEMEFYISPKLLLSIPKRGSTCSVFDGRLMVNAEKFVFVVSIVPKSTEEKS